MKPRGPEKGRGGPKPRAAIVRPPSFVRPGRWGFAAIVFCLATVILAAWWDRYPTPLSLFRDYWNRDKALLVPVWPGIAMNWLANARAVLILAAIQASAWLAGRRVLAWVAGGRGPRGLWRTLIALGLGQGILAVLTLGLGTAGLLQGPVLWTMVATGLALSVSPDWRRRSIPFPIAPGGITPPAAPPAAPGATPAPPAGGAAWYVFGLCAAIAAVSLGGVIYGFVRMLQYGPQPGNLFIRMAGSDIPRFAGVFAAVIAGCALAAWWAGRRLPGWQVRALAACVAFFAVVSFIPALIPPWFYDSLVYHLAVPEQYLIAHKVCYLPHTFISNYPFLQEMLYMLCMGMGSDVAAKLLHWSDGMLAAAAAYALALPLAGRLGGWLAAAFFLSTPTLQLLQQVSMVELGLTWFITLAVMAAAGAAGWAPAGSRPVPRGAWLLLLGWFLGLAHGVKYIGVTASMLLLGWLLLEQRRSQMPWRRVMREHALVIGWASVWTGVWLWKNWALTGNPLYPFFDRLLPSLNWDASRQHLWMVDNTKYGTGRGSIMNWIMMPAMLSGVSPDFGTITINAFPILLLPLLFLHRALPRPVAFLAVFAALFSAAWATSSQQVRFLMPMVPSAAAAAAFVVIRMGGSSGLARAELTAISGWILVVSMYGTIQNRYTSNVITSYTSGRMTRESLLTGALPYYRAVDWVNRNLGAHDRVLFMGGDESYYCNRARICDSIYDYSTLGRLADRSTGPADLAARLRRLRVTHLLVNERRALEYAGYGIFEWSDRARRNFLEMWAAYLRPSFSSLNMQVLEVLRLPVPPADRKVGLPSFFHPLELLRDIRSHVLSFDSLCLKNQYPAAHEVANELVKIAPLAEESFSCRGYTYGQQDRVREAERDYAAAIRLGYAPGLVHYNLGIYLANRGKYAESLVPFGQAGILDAGLEELSRARIVDVNVALKRYPAALAQAEALWRMSPADPKRKELVEKIRALMAGRPVAKSPSANAPRP